MEKSELVDVSLIVLAETEKAIQVTEELKDKDGRLIKHWLPKSQVQFDNDPNVKVQTITMPRWLFEEKGLTSDA